MNENEFLPGNIRDRIVDLKRMTNVNNKTIAEKTGISESLLSRIESGKQQSVNDDVVLKLAKFFGVSTDFLLGRTNVPDKKNYTIEELGLSAQAARNLYTGSVDVNVVNRLLAEPEFATLTLMIADYFDDSYATAIATQNQIHQSTAELFSRIAREDKQKRQKATSLSKQARAQYTSCSARRCSLHFILRTPPPMKGAQFLFMPSQNPCAFPPRKGLLPGRGQHPFSHRAERKV